MSLLDCYECDRDIYATCNSHAIEWIMNKNVNCQFHKILSIDFDKYIMKETKTTLCNCQRNEMRHLQNSLPDIATFKQSKLYPDEIGVWSVEFIAKGTMFGPFWGKISEIKRKLGNVFEV